MQESILGTLGSPLVRIHQDGPATVAAKVEAFNPGGSVKTRPALEMIRTAERTGKLDPGDGLVEATSGNTGIGLALVAAVRGYDLALVMPESVSTERRRLIRAYGADLHLVSGGMSDATERARRLAEREGRPLVSQFEHPANPEAHRRTTAEELLEQVGDRRIDALVAAVGTGGTITGTARGLRDAFPDLRVVGVEPASNPVLSRGEPAEDEFQGMGPDFVPPLLDAGLLDDVESVTVEAAEAECRRLAREEGLLVGQSSGAASLAASRVGADLAKESEDTPLVVTILPDTGERYLSAGVFDDVGECLS